MQKRFGAAVLAGLALAGAAQAQEFRGAEIQAEILAFTDDSALGETSYRGSAEFGVFGGIGGQVDLGFNNSRTVDLGARNLALHGTYDVMGLGTAGLFYARDSDSPAALGGREVTSVGLEGSTALGFVTIDGALGTYDGEGVDGALGTVQARYEIGSALAITGRAGFLGGDVEAGRLGIGGEYQLGGGPTLYGEIGRAGVEGDSDTYLTLGARLAIGPNGGTSFGERGIFSVLTGN